MAQETLKSLIAVIMTLPIQEQQQVIFELQENVNRNSNRFEPTEEQKARLRESYRQAKNGS